MSALIIWDFHYIWMTVFCAVTHVLQMLATMTEVIDLIETGSVSETSVNFYWTRRQSTSYSPP